MNKFHHIVSIVFQPLLMPTYGIILLMNLDVFNLLPNIWRWEAIGGTILFTAILPVVPILFMMRKGEVSDMFISKREQRTMPYLFSCMSYLFWCLFLWRTMQFPPFIVAIGAATTLSIFLIVFINLKWKISAHMSGVGGLVGAIYGISYRMAMNPLWMLVIVITISALVAISRIELKAHTMGQVFAGFMLNFTLVLAACIYF